MNARQAIAQWHIGKLFKLYPVSTGIFNETHIARSNTGVYVLQRLHPLISHKEPTESYMAASVFLASKNMPAQRIILSKRGGMLVKDGARMWRLMTAVPGHVFTQAKNTLTVAEAGRQLGAFHATFKDFKAPIKRPLAMFRYGTVLKALRRNAKRLTVDEDKRVREAADLLLSNFPSYFLPKGLTQRLIHTDPKISNFIFDDNDRAVAMIDMDTIQRLPPLYDVGDALRSLCGKEEDDPRNTFDVKKYRAFLQGYRKGSGTYLSKREWRLVPQATALVILGLAARFLNDCIDDSYFNWDSTRYPSRKAHNLARALGQIALYKDFTKKVTLRKRP